MGQKRKLTLMKKRKMAKSKKINVYAKAFIIGILVLFMMNFVYARNEFTGGSFVNGNSRIEDTYIYYSYSSLDRPSGFIGNIPDFGDTKDYIPVGKSDDVVLHFSTSMAQHNIDYPYDQVDFCRIYMLKLNWNQISIDNLLIGNFSNSTFQNAIVFNQTYFPDGDVNDIHLFQLHDGDYFYADFFCSYLNVSSTIFHSDVPIEMHTSNPTFNCKNCQVSAYAQSISQTQKKSTFDNYNSIIHSHINKFVLLIFEFSVYLFWLFLIAMFFFVIGMIFWVMYWVYLWLVQFEK